ncbi:MAG TPA: tannase/feruloyl esterase family alpha/beta hydrolase [Caulobacteraceae bacterium]|nr:tannase/feruloyl esterase family alpha/beta hydrolase [Caulobacteraceae bacterium]
MRRIGLAALASLVAPLVALWAGAAAAATPCAALTALRLPHASVTAASYAKAGRITACQIEVTSTPTPDSDIRIEVWIPEGDAWNGRYLQLGNGGFAGNITSASLQSAAAAGYAVAATDDGHEASGTDASWAVGHPEKVIDFGWRALKETTDTAKALIRAYQGWPARYAYFTGCSDGGREALIEAQRFPDDFDGIVAGAPAYSFSGLFTLAAYDQQALARPGAYLTPAALKALQAGALAACAGGGSYIVDEAACRFDPAKVACPSGQARADCLTPPQVAAARAIQDGVRTPGFSYPGNAPGAQGEPYSWDIWITGTAAAHVSSALMFQFANAYWAEMVFGEPDVDIRKLDLAKAQAEAAGVARIVDATDPDLSRFRAHGGKLIQWHGWNDPAIPAAGSIVYYEDVRRRLGEVDAFYRLYLLPGVLHCGDGPGPGKVAWLDVLRAWVEQGHAPGPLRAAASTPLAAPADVPQPLCPYPATSDGDRCTGVEMLGAPPPPR